MALPFFIKFGEKLKLGCQFVYKILSNYCRVIDKKILFLLLFVAVLAWWSIYKHMFTGTFFLFVAVKYSFKILASLCFLYFTCHCNDSQSHIWTCHCNILSAWNIYFFKNQFLLSLHIISLADFDKCNSFFIFIIWILSHYTLLFGCLSTQ